MVARGGGCVVALAGVHGCSCGGMHGCSWGGMHGCSGGGVCGEGGHVWRGGGACMVKGGMHGEGGMCGEGGCAWQRGVCGEWGGVCGEGGAWYAPPPRDMAGHCAGGTHPTGMHSCFICIRFSEKQMAKKGCHSTLCPRNHISPIVYVIYLRTLIYDQNKLLENK